MPCQVAVPPVPPAVLCCWVPGTSVGKNSNIHKGDQRPAAALSALCVRSYLSWLPIARGTKQILLPLAVHVAMPPKSEKAHYAAYFAMKHTNCNTRLAKKLYVNWMPDEPVAKWAEFANAC